MILKSISSDIIHERESAFLAELIMINRNPELKNKPLFWKEKEYQNSFRGFLVHMSTRLKYVPFDILYKVITENNSIKVDKKFEYLITQELLNRAEMDE